jgi:hypothetical protein
MNIKRLFVLTLIVFFMFGSIIIIRRIWPGPDKTIYNLINALQAGNKEKIESCFTGEALLYMQKLLEDKNKGFFWYTRDYYKDIVWRIDREKKIDDITISCFIYASGGKSERWEFSNDIEFTKVGWWSWRISKIPKVPGN